MKTLGIVLYCVVFFAPMLALCLLMVFGYDVLFRQVGGATILLVLGIIGGAAVSEAVQ